MSTKGAEPLPLFFIIHKTQISETRKVRIRNRIRNSVNAYRAIRPEFVSDEHASQNVHDIAHMSCTDSDHRLLCETVSFSLIA